MDPFIGNGRNKMNSLCRNDDLRSHLMIIILVVASIIFGSLFGWEKTKVEKPQRVRDFVYLDPIDTAFAVENLAPYTANINENLNYLEETLFFTQEKSDEYLSKSSSGNLTTEQTKLEREYIVQNGDTITSIAKKFDMHVGTIYERNGLSADSIEKIKPGDKLIVPAYDQTDSKDWLVALNAKKEAERQRLLALQRQQEKEKQKKLAAKKRNTYYRDSSDGRATTVNTSGSNSYPYGWCTYYAASRKNIPGQWGNAGGWLGSAKSAGYATGGSPQPGAIIVTGESWAGHVGIVEDVNGSNVTIREMNYNGWGVVSSRTINTGNPVIKGYIY